MNRNRLGTVLVLIVVAGCHKHPRGVTAAPPAAPPAAVVAPIPAALIEAESAFDAGEYLRAAVSYDFYFQSRPQSNEMDRIRFRYGVAQSLSGVSGMEAASTDTFNKLIRDFPESSYVGPARMALLLQGEVSRLQSDKTIRDERIRQLTALLPAPAPVLPPTLAEAEAAFTRGDFQRAASAYESYLQSKPQASGMDGILFRFGVSQSLSNASPRETASTETFKQLIKDYSGSPYAASAKRILDYRETLARTQQSDSKAKDDKIRQLTDELDKLKKIDSERRRTP
ncbi:MAG TPA: outer membrane protein assembly factor BamD [Terriglobia bacterium]|nr:outer membrane protein assembly factor BamD [Terriglobia bacterium]